MKLTTELENFKGVFARVMSSKRLSFVLVEIEKNYSLTTAVEKNLCYRLEGDQRQPGSFSQRGADERESGNEVSRELDV